MWDQHINDLSTSTTTATATHFISGAKNPKYMHEMPFKCYTHRGFGSGRFAVPSTADHGDALNGCMTRRQHRLSYIYMRDSAAKRKIPSASILNFIAISL